MRHLLGAFLLRHEILYPGRTSWALSFYRWLGDLSFDDANSQSAFTQYHLRCRRPTSGWPGCRNLNLRGVHHNKVCVSVARELAGFIWAVARQADDEAANAGTVTQ